MTRRVALWSGPRSLSTALLRAWENRSDAAVWDEPLYAYYLLRSGLPHPMREAIIAAGETDWREVTRRCTEASPAPLFVQKHMAGHLLPEVDDAWLAELEHVILIRDPRRIVASYLRAREVATIDDIGIRRLDTLDRQIAARCGRAPLVVDADALRSNPERVLRVLCDALRLPFEPSMLAWPAGPRDSDGVWAPHWYASVWRSTGFTPPSGPVPTLTGTARAVADAVMPTYERLQARAL